MMNKKGMLWIYQKGGRTELDFTFGIESSSSFDRIEDLVLKDEEGAQRLIIDTSTIQKNFVSTSTAYIVFYPREKEAG